MIAMATVYTTLQRATSGHTGFHTTKNPWYSRDKVRHIEFSNLERIETAGLRPAASLALEIVATRKIQLLEKLLELGICFRRLNAWS